MERITALCLVLTFVSICQTVPQEKVTVTAVHGRLGIGQITGGKFGPGSFSIGAPGQKITSKFETEDGEPVAIIKPKPHRKQNPPQQDDLPNISNMEDGAEIDSSKLQKIHEDSGHRGKGGEGGKGGGQITIGKVVIAKNNDKQEERRENNNQEPVTLLEAVSSFDGPINTSKGKPISEGTKVVQNPKDHAGAGATSWKNQNLRPEKFIPEKTLRGSLVNDNGNVYTGGPNERWVWQ
ncbi:hypothetical protein HW555_001268 [Spodoptera exigua]|uniref:Uncharacterized protein n=1 Tax=Spodoptera exigua TaxID=7107 RepID=A0A835GS82_SPOEX|nr:hypothetical protein HW555_001268 [Spodoptera exigua]